MRHNQLWFLAIIVTTFLLESHLSYASRTHSPKADSRISSIPPGTWALLVGVSEYPTNPKRSLLGPKNDIRLVSRFLQELQVPGRQMMVLADGISQEELPPESTLGLPTHDAILAAFALLKRKAQSGELSQVLIHMSGHGAQQPDTDGDESDGFDEIFLPRDIGSWNSDIQAVANAIDDDTLSKSIDGIREAGANVIAVFDNCHSGTMTRGAPLPSDIVFRKVTQSDLGIPTQTNLTRKRFQPSSTKPVASKKGGYIAFYAASATEETPEMKLDGQQQGLHTTELYQALMQATTGEQPGTYRQVAEQELLGYQTRGWRRSTPQVEGTLLDKPVFGFTSDFLPTKQWPIFKRKGNWYIKAGSLHGLKSGSILSLHSSALSHDASSTIGHIEAVAVQAFESKLNLLHPSRVSKEKLKGISLSQLKKGYYGRIAIEKIGFILRIAPPVASRYQKNPLYLSKSRRTIQKVIAEGAGRFSLSSDSSTHVRTVVHNDSLIFMPPDAAWPDQSDPASLKEYIESHFVSITLKKKNQGELFDSIYDTLVRISRVRNLFEVTAALPLQEGNLQTEVETSYGGQALLLSPHKKATLRNGATLKISVKNTHRRELDVTALFVDSRYGITALFPYPDERAEARIASGTKKVILEAAIDTSETKGTEYLIVIGVPVKRGSDIQEFTALEQASLSATRGHRTATNASNGFSTLLVEATHGTATRGMKRRPKKSRSAPMVSVFTWATVD